MTQGDDLARPLCSGQELVSASPSGRLRGASLEDEKFHRSKEADPKGRDSFFAGGSKRVTCEGCRVC